MDYIKVILFAVLCNSAVLVMAQDNSGTDLYKENYDLKKELGEKEAKIRDLEREVDGLRIEKSKADSLLRVEKNKAKSKEQETKIKNLEEEKKTLMQQLADCSTNAENAASQKEKDYQDRIQIFRQQHSQDSVSIASMKKELADLSSFRKMWLTQLAASVDEKWLNKPYSLIDVNELQSSFAQYEEFASEDKKIADARDKLKVLLDNARLYDQGVKVVNSRYVAAQVNSVAAQIKNLHDKTTEQDKRKELSSLYWQLNNYGVTVEIFQDVIKAVDSQTHEQSSHKAAWPLVKAVIDKQEKEKGNITAIKEIPWMSEQYNLYYKSLEKNCIAPNKVRDDIMSLQP